MVGLLELLINSSIMLVPDPLQSMASGTTTVAFDIGRMVKIIVGVFGMGMVSIGIYKIFYEESKTGIILLISGFLIGSVAFALIALV